MSYKYRGLPCNIQPDDLLWCVSGVDAEGGSGVLEWCYSKEDAEDRLQIMAQHPRFRGLEAHPFLDAGQWSEV